MVFRWISQRWSLSSSPSSSPRRLSSVFSSGRLSRTEKRTKPYRGASASGERRNSGVSGAVRFWPPPDPHRLLRLELRELGSGEFYRGTARAHLARALRPPFRHGRGEQHLLPAAEPRRGRELGSNVPPGFLFALKASRYLTHVKRLRDLGPGLERFYERIEPLLRSPKLGPDPLAAAAELPARRRAARGRARAAPAGAAALLRVPPPVLVRRRRLRAAARARRRARDRRPAGGGAFQAHVFTADWTLVRFHYGSRGRRGNYSERELRSGPALRELEPEVEIFAYFNNDWEVFAVAERAAGCR